VPGFVVDRNRKRPFARWSSMNAMMDRFVGAESYHVEHPTKVYCDILFLIHSVFEDEAIDYAGYRFVLMIHSSFQQ
jgi:hypothetical protein